MRVALAYIFIVLLWATTPLAIKWSADGSSFIFGVAARMSIGLICTFILLLLSRKSLVWNSLAKRTYFAVALQVYGAMLSVYWAAQFIPSGWVSVIFGLTPFITALLSAFWLGEKSLGWESLCAYSLGIAGLAVMFHSAFHISMQSVLAIVAILFSAFLQAFSAVWVKRLHSQLPALTQVTGGLLFSVPWYLITWYYLDGQVPSALPLKSIASILYLGLIATPIGFALYYYVLTHLAPTRVALITLITPVLSLLLGHYINHEAITLDIIIGSSLILSALLIHSLTGQVKKKKIANPQSSTNQ